MQFFVSKEFYFVKCIRTILRISRSQGELRVVGHSELAKIDDLYCLGEIHAVIGKLTDSESVFLLAVTHSSKVAIRAKTGKEIRKIERICALPIDSDYEVDVSYFGPIPTHLQKIKKSKFIKLVSGYAPPVPQSKVVDEILRLFNDNGDFYYETDGGDITKNLQTSALSKEFNDDFFWNKNLLSDIFAQNLSDISEWVVPVVQGFVAQNHFVINGEDITPTDLTLTLISRRSTRRAGTRYLRRGVDDEGNVANFVETELIIDIFEHQLAFIQIRGSVPVYWSQKGYKYRPPLTIDKTIDASLPVFEKHMNKLMENYGKPVISVNLVNQSGRELCLAQSHLEHILKMNSPDLGYISFDFHYHCRALKFHKVADLVAAMKDKLTEIGYCWIDKSGELVLRQKGVIRTNCVDCLDRTNVVQGAISQVVALSQFRRLGLISPLQEEAPESLVRILQSVWANNGDAISRQYAGTDALKGDVTRNGQRKLTGLVKDGYSSASRFYLSHMRDAQRQLAIDTMLAGRPLEPEIFEAEGPSDDEAVDGNNTTAENGETTLSVPDSVLTHSRSDGLLSAQTGFVSKLSTKLKTPWKASAPDVVDADGNVIPTVAEIVDPFQQYKDDILQCKSLIKML